MIKCKFLVRSLMLATLAAGVTACSGNEPIESLAEAGENAAEEPSRITITIQGPGEGTLTYPGMVTSRAEIQTDDEKRIYSVEALIFQQKDNATTETDEDFVFYKSYYFDKIQTLNATQATPIELSDGSTMKIESNNYISELQIPEELHGKKIKVALIANHTELGTLTDQTFNNLVSNNFTETSGGEGTTALKDNQFIMSATATCEGNETTIMSAWGIKMEATLVRLVARIDIKNFTPGLTINEVTLNNAASRSYIFAQSTLASPNNTDPVKFTPFNALLIPMIYDEQKPQNNLATFFYMFEKPVTSESESPCVNIKYSLKYEGSDITSKSEINVLFKNETEFVNVERNHLYTIVLGDGTPINDGLVNAKFVVNAWTPGDKLASEMDPDSDTRVEDNTELGN